MSALADDVLVFAPDAEVKTVPAQFARARERRNGDLLTRTAAWRVRTGALVKTGELLDEAVLRERVTFLSELVTETAQTGLDELWSAQGLAALLSSKRSFAYRALEAAHGRLAPPPGVHLDSRAVWLAQEVCGRTLRSCAHQRDLITSLLERGRAPAGTDKVSARNARRAITKVITARKRAGVNAAETLPSSFFEVRPAAPQLGRPTLPLACTDRQFVRVEVSETLAQCRLFLKLPVVARPASVSDWQWHVLMFDVPEHTQARLRSAGAGLRLPSLHVYDRRVLARFPVEFPAPEQVGVQAEDGSRRVLALDWGERRLLTATVLEKGSDGVIREIAGPFGFDARLAQARMERQRGHAKHLKTLVDRNQNLHPEGLAPAMQARVGMLEVETERIWRARDGLQVNVAHHAARWATGLAVQFGCREAAVEDLKSMEPTLRGRRLRDRLNHQVRATVFKFLTDKLAELGIRTVTEVFAAGTSSDCPRCGQPHQHVRAPDDHSSGRGWSYCACGSDIDRDYAGSLAIGAKALTDPQGRALTPVNPRPQAEAYSAKPYLKGARQPSKPRVARSRARRDPARQPARTRLRARTINLHRSARQRPEGTGSRPAVMPATQPVRSSRSTHCATRTRTLDGFALAKASRPRVPNLSLVNT